MRHKTGTRCPCTVAGSWRCPVGKTTTPEFGWKGACGFPSNTPLGLRDGPPLPPPGFLEDRRRAGQIWIPAALSDVTFGLIPAYPISCRHLTSNESVSRKIRSSDTVQRQSAAHIEDPHCPRSVASGARRPFNAIMGQLHAYRVDNPDPAKACQPINQTC